LVVFCSPVVDEAERRHSPVLCEHCLHGLHQGACLGIAIRRVLHRFAIDPERDVVEEDPVVDHTEVHPAFYSVAEGIQRPQDVMPIDPDVEGEVVACAGGHADERKVALCDSRSHDR
jgi:hypothetical protein